MLDRTDIQLILCETLMEMDTDELIDLTMQLTGEDLEMHNAEQDIVVGSLESLAISDPQELKKWLGFMLYAFGERVPFDVEV